MIDEVLIECEEHGFELCLLGDLDQTTLERYLTDESATGIRLRLSQDAAIQLLAQARTQIGPWLADAEAALGEWRAMQNLADDAEGYDLDDPKHPGFRERLADIADARRKREREHA